MHLVNTKMKEQIFAIMHAQTCLLLCCPLVASSPFCQSHTGLSRAGLWGKLNNRYVQVVLYNLFVKFNVVDKSTPLQNITVCTTFLLTNYWQKHDGCFIHAFRQVADLCNKTTNCVLALADPWWRRIRCSLWFHLETNTILYLLYLHYYFSIQAASQNLFI